MCNLNILIRVNKEKSLRGFIQSITANSYSTNNDADGFFCDGLNRVIKSSNKLDYTTFKELDKSNIVISHQRIATSGFSERYHQPFKNDDFVLVHNGIINNFKTSDKFSDTFCFWLKFNWEFNKLQRKNKDKSREWVLTEVLDELFKEDLGSYSIFIYDIKTKKSYYFKDRTTNINFYKTKDFLYITTSNTNAEFLPMVTKTYTQYDIKARIIYKIEGLKVFRIKEMREVVKPISTFDYFDLSDDKSEVKTLSETDNTTTGDLIESARGASSSTDSTNTTTNDLKNYCEYLDTSISQYGFICDYCNKRIEGMGYYKGNLLYCEECLNAVLPTAKRKNISEGLN